jgi:hypothetical protein
MKDAKEAMDTLAGRIEEKIKEERVALMEEANNKIAQLKLNYIFKEVPQNIQENTIRPFEEIIAKASRQQYIGNLKSDRNILPDLYTRQLNYLAAYKTGLDGVSDHPLQPIVRYTSLSKVEKEVRLSKSQLENLEDVDTYISKLRKAIEDKIKDNYRITLN